MFFIEEAIISGLISKIVNDSVDITKERIKQEIQNKKAKHHNIESQIYNVIVNVINQITYNKFENDQDKVFQATEKLLIGYKESRGDSIEVVKSGLQFLGENVNNEKYIEFKKLLYQEISKSDYEELFRQISLIQQDEEISKASRIEKKIDKVQQSADETNRRLNAYYENNRGKDNIQSTESVKSRTQEYADKWDANMFLNDYDEWDENAGVNVKLKDVYIDNHLPHFIYGHNEKESDNLDVLLSKLIMNTNENMMLLILGQPGIGKSTLITWIIVNFADRINDILVYRFASDLGNTDWKNGRISNRVIEELGLNHNDLNGKILILDGFDEISIEADRRRDILDSLYIDWIYNKTINNFSLIITCRENYVPQFAVLKCKYITLQSWDEIQIRSFCNIFQEKTDNGVAEVTIQKLCKNKEILGIPLILYMILALNISVEKEGSIVDIYDKIFSLEGGIYDRCIDNKSFANKHRIAEVKRQIHQISREIAIWMFENNSERASITQKEYIDICDGVMRKLVTENVEIEQDFKIGSYFKLIKHCDGIDTEELCFVHRSIYEYFVAETIYDTIEESIICLTEKSQEEFAHNVAKYLKKGEISYTIGNYIERKIAKLYIQLNIKKQKIFYNWWEQAVSKMMKYGMLYFSGENIRDLSNVIENDIQCFLNLLEILRLILNTSEKTYIMEDVDRRILEKYIKYSYIFIQGNQKDSNKFLDLANLSLANISLAWMDLSGVNFAGADLTSTELTGANLTKAGIAGVDLSKAILTKAIISENQAISLSKECDLEGVWIYNEKKDEYKMYE